MTTSTVAAPVGTTTWKLDSDHAHVAFAVRHLMISKVKGQFTGVEGTLRLRGEDATTARLDVEIVAASVDTRVEQRDQHLRSPDFLDAARFPVLTFRGEKVERSGDDRLLVTGDLTIRDVTREVVLDVTERGRVTDPWGGERIGYEARTRINRKDFGLTWNQALETGGVLVGKKVALEIEAELIQE
jgi:polyisoprenoid-binding protein YceI